MYAEPNAPARLTRHPSLARRAHARNSLLIPELAPQAVQLSTQVAHHLSVTGVVVDVADLLGVLFAVVQLPLGLGRLLDGAFHVHRLAVEVDQRVAWRADAVVSGHAV